MCKYIKKKKIKKNIPFVLLFTCLDLFLQDFHIYIDGIDESTPLRPSPLHCIHRVGRNRLKNNLILYFKNCVDLNWTLQNSWKVPLESLILLDIEHQLKLDGVGPVDNRPSTDKLHHSVRKKTTCDTWHVTRDTWHVTCDTWHVWGGEHSLKISAP